MRGACSRADRRARAPVHADGGGYGGGGGGGDSQTPPSPSLLRKLSDRIRSRKSVDEKEAHPSSWRTPRSSGHRSRSTPHESEVRARIGRAQRTLAS